MPTTIKGNLDWAATEAKASKMSDSQLRGAIRDIQRTLPFADAMDRIDDGDRGGYYRDEASVLHGELGVRAMDALANVLHDEHCRCENGCEG